MANPIESKRETILDYIVTRLAGIRKVDGYWYDLKTEQVTRRMESIETVNTVGLPLVVVLPGDDTADPANRHPDKAGRILEVYLLAFLKSDDPTSSHTDLERFIRDIKKRMNSDVGLGSNVVDFQFANVRSDLGVVGMPEFGVVLFEMAINFDEYYATP